MNPPSLVSQAGLVQPTVWTKAISIPNKTGKPCSTRDHGPTVDKIMSQSIHRTCTSVSRVLVLFVTKNKEWFVFNLLNRSKLT